MNNTVCILQDKITRAAHIDPYSNETIQYQKELIWSDAARLYSIRSVLSGKGRKTPGVDGVVYEKDDIEAIMRELSNLRSYKSGKVKRVWIPKTSGKLRPLGIPNQIDRI